MAGTRLLCETFPARQERGAGVPAVERLQYGPSPAVAQLAGVRHLILAGARAPVLFFAYPRQPSSLIPPECRAPLSRWPIWSRPTPGRPRGRRHTRRLRTATFTIASIAAVVAALMPEGSIVSDEAVTSRWQVLSATQGAAPHDWLTITGGAIGQGLPVATGAALACPDRPVIALQADGSAMYTITALWTHAREGLDITTVIFSNRSYAILKGELAQAGLPANGAGARGLLELSRPDLDFAAVAAGMGVPAVSVRTAGEFAGQLHKALAEPGPHLIEAVLDPPR